jgi:hypothetical protein
VPALGQGTWRMGERADRRRSEIAALQLGIELGMTVVPEGGSLYQHNMSMIVDGHTTIEEVYGACRR